MSYITKLKGNFVTDYLAEVTKMTPGAKPHWTERVSWGAVLGFSIHIVFGIIWMAVFVTNMNTLRDKVDTIDKNQQAMTIAIPLANRDIAEDTRRIGSLEQNYNDIANRVGSVERKIDVIADKVGSLVPAGNLRNPRAN